MAMNKLEQITFAGIVIGAVAGITGQLTKSDLLYYSGLVAYGLPALYIMLKPNSQNQNREQK